MKISEHGHWGCFGFDGNDRWPKARAEELPGLVKRQKKITADNNVVNVDFNRSTTALAA